MTSKPREWPNLAREARDRTAEEANEAIRVLKPLIRGDALTREEVIRKQAIALDSVQTIIRLMESVGAPTRPI